MKCSKAQIQAKFHKLQAICFEGQSPTIFWRHLLSPEQNAKSTALAYAEAGWFFGRVKMAGKNTTFPTMAIEADEFIIKRYYENTLFEIPINPGFRLFSQSDP